MHCKLITEHDCAINVVLSCTPAEFLIINKTISLCSANEDFAESDRKTMVLMGKAMMNFEQVEVADTPQTDCETCRHYKLACELFSEVCKYEPTTQTETQNSNLTFDTPQTETKGVRYCNECKWFRNKQVCGRCRSRNLFAEADAPQTERMTEEEIDTMLAKVLVGQTDCGWK